MRVVRKIAAVAGLVVLLVPGLARASSVDAAGGGVNAPVGAVTLAPGATGNITMNFTVTGKQEGTATFEVNRDWTLTAGSFSGSNPTTFTILPRNAGDPATLRTTSGTVTVAAGHASGGPFTLAVPVFNITNSNATGAKLGAGSPSSYAVTVSPPPDSTPPVITKIISGTVGANGWYTSDVSVAWSVTDAQSAVVIDSGCLTQNFTTETTGTSSSCVAHS